MKINYKFTDTDSDDTLRAYADQKIASFTKLLNDEENEGAVCVVEFRRFAKRNSGDVCTAEVTLEAAGKIHRVSKDEPTFEKAIDKVKDDILHSLREEKEKEERFVKQGGRVLKKMLRMEDKQ